MKVNNIEISHPDKVLFPEAGITKKDLSEYYCKISSYMLPHIKNYPLTLRNFPKGIDQEGFFSKHAPQHFPKFVERVKVPMHSKNQDMKMVAADEQADLVYFARQNTVEIHMGLAQTDKLNNPDQMVFDLDPPDDDFDKVRDVAHEFHTFFEKNEITSFIKTTGSRGLHIHIPLHADNPFKDVKNTARKLAEEIHQKCPEISTLEQRKDKRGKKVFIDYLRNDYGMTAIACYSVRAREIAPVAIPIDWEELNRSDFHPQSYTIKNVFRRIAQKADPWENFHRHRIQLKSLL